MPTYEEVVLGDGPVAYYRLGEASGPALTEVGSASGTFVGTPTRAVAGALLYNPSKAVRFNADGDYFTAPNPKVVPGAGSVEAWVNTSTWGDTNQHGIFQNVPAGSWTNQTNGISMFRWTGSPAPFYWRIVGSNGTIYDIAPTWSSIIPANAWVHIVGTWDATTSRLYVNGQQVGSIGIVTPNAFPSTSVTWARGHNTGLRGDGDEFAIYDRALTAAEVYEHYDAGTNQPPPPYTGTISVEPVEAPVVERNSTAAFPSSDVGTAYPNSTISGKVYLASGAIEPPPVEGATVLLMRESDNVAVAQGFSGPGGVYSFVRGDLDTETYYVVAFSFAGGTTQVHGTSNRGLVPLPSGET